MFQRIPKCFSNSIPELPYGSSLYNYQVTPPGVLTHPSHYNGEAHNGHTCFYIALILYTKKQQILYSKDTKHWNMWFQCGTHPLCMILLYFSVSLLFFYFFTKSSVFWYQYSLNFLLTTMFSVLSITLMARMENKFKLISRGHQPRIKRP